MAQPPAALGLGGGVACCSPNLSQGFQVGTGSGLSSSVYYDSEPGGKDFALCLGETGPLNTAPQITDSPVPPISRYDFLSTTRRDGRDV